MLCNTRSTGHSYYSIKNNTQQSHLASPTTVCGMEQYEKKCLKFSYNLKSTFFIFYLKSLDTNKSMKTDLSDLTMTLSLKSSKLDFLLCSILIYTVKKFLINSYSDIFGIFSSSSFNFVTPSSILSTKAIKEAL